MDERDTEILNVRQAAFLARTEPKQGDFVRFADGTLRRISHVWFDENGKASHIQTSHGGTFYVGEGYMSYSSGALFSSIEAGKFTRTGEIIAGRAWFFHHDLACAGGGVDVIVNCPVWECSEQPNA
jgi:hypothetical protein